MGAAAATELVTAIRSIRDGQQRQGVAPSWYDSELAWFVNQREGEMGVRAVPVEPGIGGDPQVNDGISDQQIRAATRARLVEQALEVLRPEARTLILAVHFHLSPRAHKEKHAAKERCVAKYAAEIAVGVAMFRSAFKRGGR